jgi:precorrin-6B methylase 2
MWIHLLALELIDGASSAVTPIPPDEIPLGGGVKLSRTYQYKYQAELKNLSPKVAEAITEQAVAVVSQEASQAQARKALQRMGFAYKQAYQEIFEQLVAEMRQAQEDEQIALIVASLL